MILEKYSFGMGDRFGRQGKAQLRAVVEAQTSGIHVAPVWNKSHREHEIVKTVPREVRAEADAAVQALGWQGPYYVDADHIGLSNVDLFMESSDFFTIDVADSIGGAAPDDAVRTFVDKYAKYVGALEIPGMDAPVEVTAEDLRAIGAKFLGAASEAGKIYRRIASARGADNCVIEISMDETDTPQTAVELFFILAAIADECIPAQTIAPRFSGRFNKGVDYVGDVDRFAKEFENDLAVLAYAAREFGLPENLKLSVHSGSDKFALYEPIRQAIGKHGAGLHLKTAGTTWLEELIGLASAGGEGLDLAKEIYQSAHTRLDELCGPYASVIDIGGNRLPDPDEVAQWSGEEYVGALRHDPTCDAYNADLRQLLHVGYKVAAEMGDRYLNALDQYEEVIAENVTENLLERHVRAIFPQCGETVGHVKGEKGDGVVERA